MLLQEQTREIGGDSRYNQPGNVVETHEHKEEFKER